MFTHSLTDTLSRSLARSHHYLPAGCCRCQLASSRSQQTCPSTTSTCSQGCSRLLTAPTVPTSTAAACTARPGRYRRRAAFALLGECCCHSHCCFTLVRVTASQHLLRAMQDVLFACCFHPNNHPLQLVAKVKSFPARHAFAMGAFSSFSCDTDHTKDNIQNTSDCCCCCGCGAVISAARPTLPDLTLRIPALNLEFPAVDPFRFPGGQSLALNIALVHAVLLCMLHFVHSILWTSAAWGARGVGTSVVVTNCSLQSIMCTSAMFTAPQL